MFDYKLEKVEKTLHRMFGRGKLTGRRIYLFGVSENTRQITGILRSLGLEPVGVLDNDRKKQKSWCGGIPVVSVDSVGDIRDAKNLYIIYSYYWREMRDQLLDKGVRKQAVATLYREDSLRECFSCAFRGKEVHRKLIRRYGDVPLFLCPYTGTGDIYLIGTFWKQYIEKNQIRDYVFLVISRACQKAALLFDIKNVVVLDKKIEGSYLVQYYMLCPDQVNLKILNDSWAQIHTNPVEWFRGYKGLMFMPLFRKFVFDLPDTARPGHPVWKDADGELEEAFLKFGLEPGNTVILSPYSNTLADLPRDFWDNLAWELGKAGFTVCTNSSGPMEPAAKGTVPVFFPLDQAPRWVEKAGYFVGARSGLCDMISGAKARKVILYGFHDRFFNGSAFEYFNLKDMGLCEDAVELQFDGADQGLCEKVLGALAALKAEEEKGFLGKLETWVERYDKIFFIRHRGRSLKELIQSFTDSRAVVDTKKKVLLLAEEEKPWDLPGAVQYCRLDGKEARTLWKLYHMYEFSDRFQIIFRAERFSEEEPWGSLFRLVDTGVLDMEEVWEALLH